MLARIRQKREKRAEILLANEPLNSVARSSAAINKNYLSRILIPKKSFINEMSIYDEIEIEDLDFNAQNGTFYYPCPCGDKFQITLVNQTLIFCHSDYFSH